MGRKRCIIFLSFVFTVGAVIQLVPSGYQMLLAGRFISGVGVGGLSMAATLYQSETAPPKVSRPLIRRSFYLQSLPPSLTSYLLHPFPPSLLPKCSLPPTIPSSLPPPPGSRPGGLDPAALLHSRHPTGRGPERGLAALRRGLAHLLRWQGLLLPPSHAPDESPRWLVAQGKSETAKASLGGIRQEDETEGELAGMQAAVKVGEVLDGTGFEGHEGLGEGGQLMRMRRRRDKGISLP
ncbi:high-affinity glucose [Nannochloropsis gaditana CCMP526]|uniref:high-affinity glucose n=1 Tax=Nannochloropsis gaditana (strain CCMP526) TaxID=1093141 RepID=UPI00029F50A4|nr:high-affinity glucose [Nannochloropsis gaditana CCMP526]EKU23320.1 high-affinity glucose [Nannochloropsis gaditana CCMP526]|eukprot:XP_005852511.1 high-affinity glucose [Nannochloropsis gaditana CCMP526]